MGQLAHQLRRVRLLRRLLPLPTAFSAVFGQSPGQVRTTLRGFGGRPFTYRRGQSDVMCMEQVLVQSEYALAYNPGPKVIVDAGANIGCTTIFFADRYPDAKIIAVEPDASNFALLEANCAGLANVTLLRAAVWSEETTLTFADPQSEKWAVSVTERAEEGVAVRAVTIPGLIEQFGLERIDILKMDIESAEKEVFSGPDLSWLDRVDQIVIELHDRFKPGCAKAFYAALAKYDFEQHISGELTFVRLRSRP